MLALGCREGAWFRLVHRSGDEVRVRVYGIRDGKASLAFDDPPRNYEIFRQGVRRPASGIVTRPDGVAVVRGTGIPADYVVMLVAERGHTWDDVLASHPSLTRASIRACLVHAIGRDARDGDECQGNEIPHLPMRARPARI